MKGQSGTSVQLPRGIIFYNFPAQLPIIMHKRWVKKTSILPVFYSCKRPKNGFCFECTGCQIWFHPQYQNMAQEDISDDPQRAHVLHCMPSKTGWAFYQRFVTDHHVYVTDITVTGFTNLDRHGASRVLPTFSSCEPFI